MRGIPESGIRFVDYASGHMNHLDVAVERAVRTGTNQMALRMSEQMMDDLGAEYVETSAHMGARPTHAEWQGQVFHVGGDTDEYPDFEESTGYGDVTGLGGANCRHSYFPFFPGISARTYTDSQLDNIDPPPFEYKGKSYTYYEAAQAQRGLERDMRKIKRELVGLDEAGKSVAELGKDFQNASIKLQMKKQTYIDFTNSANAAYKTFPGARLPYRMDNAQVWRFGHRTAQKAVVGARNHHTEWLKSIGAESSPLADIAKYYQAKYTNSRDYRLLVGYNGRIAKKELSPLVGYELFAKTKAEAEERLIGLKTSTGIKIREINDHFVARVIGSHKREGVSIADVIEALLRPQDKKKTVVRGDIRMTYCSAKCKVTVSETDGIVIQTNPWKRSRNG